MRCTAVEVVVEYDGIRAGKIRFEGPVLLHRFDPEPAGKGRARVRLDVEGPCSVMDDRQGLRGLTDLLAPTRAPRSGGGR